MAVSPLVGIVRSLIGIAAIVGCDGLVFRMDLGVEQIFPLLLGLFSYLPSNLTEELSFK